MIVYLTSSPFFNCQVLIYDVAKSNEFKLRHSKYIKLYNLARNNLFAVKLDEFTKHNCQLINNKMIYLKIWWNTILFGCI